MSPGVEVSVCMRVSGLYAVVFAVIAQFGQSTESLLSGSSGNVCESDRKIGIGAFKSNERIFIMVIITIIFIIIIRWRRHSALNTHTWAETFI